MSPIGIWQGKVTEKGPRGGYKGTFHVIFALTGGGIGDKVGMVFYTFLSLDEEDTKSAAILVLKEDTGDHIKLREIGCDYKAPTNGRNGTGTLKKM